MHEHINKLINIKEIHNFTGVLILEETRSVISQKQKKYKLLKQHWKNAFKDN